MRGCRVAQDVLEDLEAHLEAHFKDHEPFSASRNKLLRHRIEKKARQIAIQLESVGRVAWLCIALLVTLGSGGGHWGQSRHHHYQ